MTIALGIDTGGTYTDAALVDYATGRVLCAAKALTTRRDLSIGIGEAIDGSSQPAAPSPAEVSLVALSTTLATNAIVEGQGSPVCLILIGYDPELIRQYGFAGRAGDRRRRLRRRRARHPRRRGGAPGRGSAARRRSWRGRTRWRPLPSRATSACATRPTSCGRGAGRGADRAAGHLWPRADQPPQLGAAGDHGGAQRPAGAAAARADRDAAATRWPSGRSPRR